MSETEPMQDYVEEYEPRTWEIGNCPNCAALVLRETVYIHNVPTFYWPCVECGFTHHSAECPELE